MRTRRLIIISVIFGFILTTISPVFDSVTVTGYEQLENHKLGMPMAFLVQHTTLTPMEDAYPFELGLLDPREHPIGIIPFSYLLSVVIAAVFAFLILFVLNKILSKIILSKNRQ
ncbi:hypothetical protein M3231_01755 [Neobacillus mesonae]|nr:hypothetical protein [Neobacillus mesonae]